MASTAVPEWRVLTLHFGSSTQRIKFSSTSTRNDLLAGIREVLGVDASSPLRFRDEDGDIVVVSPQGMPSGTVLHVAIESGVPVPAARPPAAPARAQQPAPPLAAPAPAMFTSRAPVTSSGPAADGDGAWKVWDWASGPLQLSGDRLKVWCAGNMESWAAYTPVLPTSGKHYIVVDFEKDRPCCATIGLVPAHLASVPAESHLGDDKAYPAMVALKAVGRGPAAAVKATTGDEPAMAIGIAFDADARRMVLLPHHDPRNPGAAIRVDDVPVPAKLVLASPKHGITAVIRPAEVWPAFGVYEGDDVRLVKT